MRYENLLKGRSSTNQENPTAIAIVNAAKELFYEKGYIDVTTREIAQKAHVNLGLIAYYFTSKENLAEIVFQDMKSHFFRITDSEDFSCLGNAERLYVQTILTWRMIERTSTPSPLKFYLEFLLESKGNFYVSDYFEELSWKIIREYNCQVTLSDNEQALVVRMLRHELNITYEKILDLVISNYLYNIGLSDQDIAAIILQSKRYLDRQ